MLCPYNRTLMLTKSGLTTTTLGGMSVKFRNNNYLCDSSGRTHKHKKLDFSRWWTRRHTRTGQLQSQRSMRRNTKEHESIKKNFPVTKQTTASVYGSGRIGGRGRTRRRKTLKDLLWTEVDGKDNRGVS